MRDSFHDELDSITQTLVEMTMLVKQATQDATTALLTADLQLAEKVIAQDDRVDHIQHELDSRTMVLLATQQPVASDLRVLVTSLRMSADLERMGDMAHHISKLARMRYPATAVPPEASLTIEEMGRVAGLIIGKLAKIIENRNLDDAKQLAIDDDEMDKLHRKLIQSLISKDWPHGAESAIDLTLLGRYYEISDIDTYTMKRRLGMKDNTENKLKELVREEVRTNTLNRLNEGSGYTVYHNSYSSAVDIAIKFAEKKGYVVDTDDVWNQISTGPKKPSDGKTNKFSLGLIKGEKVDKKKLQIQIYGMGNGRYELNMYIG
jgi:phosphate transport system protein